MAEIHVRNATGADVRAIARFQTQAWADAYAGLVPQTYLDRMSVDDRERRWAQRIDGGVREVALAESALGELLGVVSWQASPEADGLPVLELSTLYVARSQYGRGVAPLLLSHALGVRPAWLWVFEDNARAIRFYSKHEFAPNGDRQIDPDTGVAEVRLVRG